MARDYRAEYRARVERAAARGITPREATGGARPNELYKAMRNPEGRQAYLARNHERVKELMGTEVGRLITADITRRAVQAGQFPVLAAWPSGVSESRRPSTRFMSLEEAQNYARPIGASLGAIYQMPDGSWTVSVHYERGSTFADDVERAADLTKAA